MTDFSEDSEPLNQAGCEGNVVPLHSARKDNKPEIVSFHRRELDQILRVYSFKVASGEWRDYAIDMLREKAVFSVFRKTTEYPLFQIVKNPRNSRRQGMYSVINATGQILKRGHDLNGVLRIFEKRPKLVRV